MTEQLALLPRISPSGSPGFFGLRFHVRKVGAVVIIVRGAFFFSSLRVVGGGGWNEAAEYGSLELHF